MSHFFQDLGDYFQNMGFWGYWIVGLVVFLETLLVVGHFLPGALFLAFVGFLCYMQVFDFPQMLAVVFVMHVLGEMTNYYLGRVKGRSLFREDSRYLKPAMIESAEKLFSRGAARIIVFSQCVGVLRAIVSFTAGMLRYNPWLFAALITACSVLWALLHLGIGFVLGASWREAAHYVEDFALVILVAIPTFLLVGWLIRLLGQNAGELTVWLEDVSRRIHRSDRYQSLSTRHKRIFAFLEARLSLTQPWGFPATLSWLAALILTGALALVASRVIASPAWRYFDLSIVNLLAQVRRPAADSLFLYITYLGSAPALLITAGVVAVVCIRARQFKSCCVIVGSVLLALAFTYLLKYALRYPRPDSTLAVVHAGGFGFPSAHAGVGVAFFISTYLWLWNHPGLTRLRMTLAFVMLASLVLVAFSRVYLGVHFPSDVLAGVLTGTISVLIVSTIAQNTVAITETRSRTDISGLLVLAVWLGSALALYSVISSPPAPRLVTARSSVARPLPIDVKSLPLRALGLTGSTVLPIDVVINGPIHQILEKLMTEGWRAVQPEDFFTSGISAPVFPAFVEGMPAEYTLQKKLDGTRLILRLWAVEQEAFVGSVVTEVLVPRFRDFNVYRVSPDIDASMEQLQQALAPLPAKRIEGFRPRGLYIWKYPFFTHGWALQVDSRRAQLSGRVSP